MEAIKIDKLTKHYGKARGVIELKLSVHEGEFFGFIGPNGAGKSTTIRALLGLIFPSSGSAQIFGKDIVKDKVAILRDVGYLPSENLFYPNMRVRDMLKLSADMRKKDCSKLAKELCGRLELDVNRKVDELSFGNRRKLAIVCALQSRPRLIILDEPTSGLDPLMQQEFFSILGEHNRDGATVFLSSHILSEVQRNCTRAAIIREGRIIACDSVSSLSKTNAKRVSLHGKIDLSRLNGIKDLKTTNSMQSFLYSGDMTELLQNLLEARVSDLSISDPDLEEIFSHYYEKEQNAYDNNKA